MGFLFHPVIWAAAELARDAPSTIVATPASTRDMDVLRSQHLEGPSILQCLVASGCFSSCDSMEIVLCLHMSGYHPRAICHKPHFLSPVLVVCCGQPGGAMPVGV